MTKNLFHIPKNSTYLLNHSVGCLPITAKEGSERFFSLWSEQASLAWPSWLEELSRFKKNIAQLVQGKPHEVSPQSNISSAVTKLLFSLPRRPGRKKIVLSKTEFPSIGFAMARGESFGYESEWIESTGLKVTQEQWTSALNGSVQLLVISHITYGTSQMNPIQEICREARKLGIYTLVDVAQSAGVVPIDAQSWGCDFISGSCIKWLCGGPGAGFLWIHSDRIAELTPIDVGWFSHSNPMEFDINHFEFSKDGNRFQGGTPSIIPFFIANSGLELLLNVGIDQIQSSNRELTHLLTEGALELGLPVLSPLQANERGGTVCLGSGKNNLSEIESKLKEFGVLTDFRPAYGIRMSPHIYNTFEEVQNLLSILKAHKNLF